MSVEQWWNGSDGGKQKYWETDVSESHVSNLKGTDLGSNPVLRN